MLETGSAARSVGAEITPGSCPPTTMRVDPEPVAPLESVAVAVTVKAPDCVYACCTLVALPGSVTIVPSPKSTCTDVIAKPVVAVAAIVNSVVVLTCGLPDGVIETVGCGFALTPTVADAGTVVPKLSVAVALIKYVPCA